MAKIYKPIYIVGQPHAGLTLIANIIKISPKIFGVTARRYYDDEGHNALYHRLPNPLRNPEGHKGTCWRYGWSHNVDKHHHTEEDVTVAQREGYMKVLNGLYNPQEENKRLVDKSQPYIIKTRYVQEIVKPHESYFIYLIRNPYSLCYQPAFHPGWYPKYGSNRDNLEIDNRNRRMRVELGCEHNINTHRYFMEDKEYLDRWKIMRFEDLMLDHRNFIVDMCAFLDLEFEEKFTELGGHKAGHRKFYPLRWEYVNQHRDIADDECDAIIERECAEIIEEFKYPKEFKW